MPDPYRPNRVDRPSPRNERVAWPGYGPLRRADSLLAGEQFYRQDENDQASYTKLFLHSTAIENDRHPGIYFINADTLEGGKGEFFADHISPSEMVRKVWTGAS